ncbi:hypothetical protein ONA70_29075 [Micromonospora yasonensis]|uniref:hypothetical protein n=1 Tax=Micromonospora yasonensis TaxID=1128667 RepID=UPI0022321735|nr:hypothetical protein [Micromonospora yasonensis]MCW3844151.1 hypothetical protein [Micromonospora yasonensis]
MNETTLVGALVVGLVVGALGRLVVPGRKAAPVWLTLALGVAAALLGAIVVGLVGVDRTQPAVVPLIVQCGFAAAAVVLAVVTAGRQGADGSSRPPAAAPEGRPAERKEWS